MPYYCTLARLFARHVKMRSWGASGAQARWHINSTSTQARWHVDYVSMQESMTRDLANSNLSLEIKKETGYDKVSSESKLADAADLIMLPPLSQRRE